MSVQDDVFDIKISNRNTMKKTVLILALFTVFCLGVAAQYNKNIIIESVLNSDTTSIGQKIIFPASQSNEVTILKVTIPPGSSTGWHKHENPVFAYVLKGTLSVELENGKTRQFSENGCFAEVVNTYHNGFNSGKENVVLIAFYLGEKGRGLSVKRENP